MVVNACAIHAWSFAHPKLAVLSTMESVLKSLFAHMTSRCGTAAQCLGTETMSLKSFSHKFSKLPKSATKADIFIFLSGVTCCCVERSVCVPPPHVMVATSSQGEWSHHLPLCCIGQWECHDNAPRQAFTVSWTGLGNGNLTKPLPCKASEHQIIWCLMHAAEQPCLVTLLPLLLPTTSAPF